jgi:hypothetical protein
LGINDYWKRAALAGQTPTILIHIREAPGYLQNHILGVIHLNLESTNGYAAKGSIPIGGCFARESVAEITGVGTTRKFKNQPLKDEHRINYEAVYNDFLKF